MTQLSLALLPTILVVEDDPAILKMVKLILEEAGFGVLSAGSADQARLVAEGFPRPTHLLALHREAVSRCFVCSRG